MDARASRILRQAPLAQARLDEVARLPTEQGAVSLMEFMCIGKGCGVASEVGPPAVEEFEYAMATAVMSRLESGEDSQFAEIPKLLNATAHMVAKAFDQAADADGSGGDSECKQWWGALMSMAEDFAKLVPIDVLGQFVNDFEVSLPALRTSYLRWASKRLADFDAQKEQDMRNLAKEHAVAFTKAESRKEDEQDAKAKDKHVREVKQQCSTDYKALETKKLEDRKRLIQQLGVSHNGALYLIMTSLLKQLTSRLLDASQAMLRARIVLLLESLLAMDHKAIANNQKNRTQEYVQPEDLDDEAVVAAALGRPAVARETAQVSDGKTETAPDNTKPATAAPNKPAAAKLSDDPSVDGALYRTFWGLQETLQFPEKLFERKENWVTFYASLRAMLALFQKYPSQDRRVRPWTAPEPTPMRHPPLASRFKVQLDDPGFRVNFMSQIMIACQALEQDGTRSDHSTGAIARQSEAVRKEFQELKTLCLKVLDQTRHGYGDTLRHLLDREPHWVSWKVNGCREFERESMEMLSVKMPVADVLPPAQALVQAQRPRLPAHVGSLLKAVKESQVQATPATGSIAGEHSVDSMRPLQVRARCESYLTRITDEDKPENGIEDEYKAKKNTVFMWQTRRLFSQHHMRWYGKQEATIKTEFMEFVNAALGIAPLAPLPLAASPAVESTDKAAEPAQAPTEGDAAASGALSAVVAAKADAKSPLAEPNAASEAPAASATSAKEVQSAGAKIAAAESAPVLSDDKKEAPPKKAAIAAEGKREAPNDPVEQAAKKTKTAS